MFLLVKQATPLPEVWLFVSSFPVILACSFSFHVPLYSDFWYVIGIVRVPLAFTYRYVQDMGVRSTLPASRLLSTTEF